MNIYYGLPPLDSGNTEEKELARRLTGNLAGVPCHTRDFTTDDPYPFDAIKGTPSLIHAFHAAKSGLPCSRLAEKNRLPLIVTCTGLDTYIDMYNSALKPQIHEVLENAASVIVPYPQMAKFIKSRMQVNSEIEVIPPGVPIFNSDFEFPIENFGLGNEERIILMDGGLFPAKNTVFAIHQLDRIANEYLNLRLVIVSTPGDTAFGNLVGSEASTRTWVKLIDRPEPEILPHLYKHAEIFINVSHAEGYNPFLLQAMALGKPVIASDIYANHAFIKDESTFPGYGTGVLYYTSPGPEGYEKIHDGDNFIDKLRHLLNNQDESKRMGMRGASYIRTAHSVEKELYLHLQLYKRILRR